MFIGPMFSGKSTRLLNISDSGRVLTLKKSGDNRYSDSNTLTTHDGEKGRCISVENLKDVDISGYSVVRIDEGQFFGDIDKVLDWCKTARVYISALNMDYEKKPFENISRIIDRCEVVKCYSKCTVCKGRAWYTRRIINSCERILIGSVGMYEPRCHECFDK